MPTGVAIRDPREQLFDAAERVLLRDGPSALTSRAVTTEAGCAKGVLHRHFADFDLFLCGLVLDRIRRVEAQAAELRAAAGTGAVVGHLAAALHELFGPVALGIVGLVITRDSLRERVREVCPADGVPLLREGTEMVAAYLDAERALGRVAPDADVATLAPTLVGAAHLLLAGHRASPPEPEAVEKVVRAAVSGVLR